MVHSSGGVGGFDLDLPSLGGDCSEGALILAVVGMMALPAIVYLADAPAPLEVERRWARPSGDVDLWGLGLTDPRTGGTLSILGMRAQVGAGLVGVEGSLESAARPESWLAWHAGALLRLPPKAHLQPALSVGYQRVRAGGWWYEGVVFALPHRWFFVPEQRGFGLDVRPALIMTEDGLDARLDAAFLLPIGPATLSLGATAFSLGAEAHLGGLAGLSARL